MFAVIDTKMLAPPEAPPKGQLDNAQVSQSQIDGGEAKETTHMHRPTLYQVHRQPQREQRPKGATAAVDYLL